MNLIHRMFKLKTIASRIFFYVIILIVLSNCLLTLSYMIIDKKHRFDETRANLQYSLLHQSIILESWAMERAAEIRYLANLPSTKQLDLHSIQQTLQNFVEHSEELASIVLLDKNGYVLLDTALRGETPYSTVSLRDRDYFIAAQRGEENMYDIVVSRATNNPVIIFSSPIFSMNETFQGLLFGAVHLTKTNEMLRQSIHGESGEILFLNREGQILSHITNRNAQNQGPRGQQKIIEERSLFHGRYMLMNKISQEEVLRPHYRMVLVMIGITLTIILTGIILLIPVSRYLLKPFSYLINAINKVKAGNYSAQLDLSSFKTAPSEIQQLMKVFNEMSATIHEQYDHLQKLSSTDALTGVPNRRMFEEHFQREWDFAKRELKPISLLFIDIDSFKQLNDTFGHQIGDHCLIKVAQSIQYSIKRARDLVARYGGEEFVVILPETDLERAKTVGERIRKHVENTQIQQSLNDSNEYVTVSIGVASVVPTQTMNKDLLIQLADEALYKAKSSGKNQVIVQNDGPHQKNL